MVYLHTGPMGVHRASFFIARAGRAATPERNRSGNQPPILCILPLVAHQLASARNYSQAHSGPGGLYTSVVVSAFRRSVPPAAVAVHTGSNSPGRVKRSRLEVFLPWWRTRRASPGNPLSTIAAAIAGPWGCASTASRG